MTDIIVSEGLEKISKEDLKIETLGELDELNSLLGVCRANSASEEPSLSRRCKVTLPEIQNDLFMIQAEVAGSDRRMSTKRVLCLEKFIDSVEKELPEFDDFIITGATRSSAYLDLARAVARRVERRMIALDGKGDAEIKDSTKSYMNRLSSFLFVLARLNASLSGIKEESPNYDHEE